MQSPQPRTWYQDLSGPAGRYPVLDSLRAMAIAWVLLRHWAVAAREHFGTLTAGPLATFSSNGWIGVDLFFVLSGFLIATHFVGDGGRSINRATVLDFYRRRAFRTMPLYWGVILLTWLGALAGLGHAFSAASFSTHFLFLQDYLGSDVMVTLWSLAVEEKFYLAAPVLAGLLSLAGRRLGSASLALVVCLMMWSMLTAAQAVPAGDYPAFFWAVRAPFHHAALGILAGVLVALHHAAPSTAAPAPAHTRSLQALFFILLTALCVLHALVDWTRYGDWTLTSWIIGLSSCLFALLVRIGLAINGRLPAFASSRPLRRVAKLSYALYLVHYPLIAPSITASHALLPEDAPASLTSVAFLLVYLMLSWSCAWVLHVALEKPFLLWRDRVHIRTTSAPAAAPVAASLHQ